MKITHTITFRFVRSDYSQIKPQLKAKKIKLTHIAKELGVSRQYVCDMFRGRQNMPRDVIAYLKAHDIIIPFSEEYIVYGGVRKNG